MVEPPWNSVTGSEEASVDVRRRNIVVVLPVFNDGPSLVQLLDQLAAVLSDRVATVSLVIVDDGSLPPISECHLDRLKDKFAGYILTLKRNVGHQRAIAVGIAYVVENKLADILVVMDADGEDEPADVPRLLGAMYDHGPAIVVAERTKRREGVVFRTFYLLYRMIFFLLTGRRIKFGNFLVLPSVLARRIANMSELWLSLPATVLLSRAPTVNVPTARSSRFFGASQMTLVSLVIHGLRALAVFVENVLTRILIGAVALLLLCGGASAVAVLQKLIGIASPGWLTTVVGISLAILASTILLCFVSLAISIAGGAGSIAPPLASFQGLIDRITKIDISSPPADSPPETRN